MPLLDTDPVRGTVVLKVAYLAPNADTWGEAELVLQCGPRDTLSSVGEALQRQAYSMLASIASMTKTD